jgi:hypothetical protein
MWGGTLQDLGFELEPEAQAIREQIWLTRDDLNNLTPQVLGSVQAIVSRQLSVIAEVRGAPCSTRVPVLTGCAGVEAQGGTADGRSGR